MARAAEPLGFDAALLTRLAETGAPGMGVEGATMAELLVAAEQLGLGERESEGDLSVTHITVHPEQAERRRCSRSMKVKRLRRAGRRRHLRAREQTSGEACARYRVARIVR